MSRDDWFDVLFFTFMAFLMAIASCSSGARMTREDMEAQAIAHGYAQHNPQTGKFEWIEQRKDGE